MTSKLTEKDINRVYVHNLFDYQWGWNYEKMRGLGYAWATVPASKRLYNEDPVAMKKALKTHLDLMNTTPAMPHLIVGADMALEEEVGIEDETAITGPKTGLMGPFAGVGDIILIVIYRAIVFSIAAYVAQGGQVVGLSIPLTAGAVVLWARYKFTWISHHQGREIATESADKMKLFTQGVTILGLTVVGGLISSVVTHKLDLTYKMGDVTLSVQETLDKISPALTPLGTALLFHRLLGKKKMNSTRLTFVLVLTGMALGNLQPMLAWVDGLF